METTDERVAKLRTALQQIIELDSSVEDTNHAMAEIARDALSADSSVSPREKLLLAEVARQRLISRGEM